MPFPEWLIEQLRQRVDLVELVGEVVSLKRVGRNYVGLCPFHQEKTPSFFIHPEWGIFKCFGCGKGGNAVTFVMEYYRMSFPEAVRFLAERVGLSIPEEEGRDTQRNDLSTLLYKALQVAAEFYHELLFRPEGAPARAYAYSRGLTTETLRTFKVGYAPDQWDALLQHLRRRGFHDTVGVEAGLIVQAEPQGNRYDRFRHRLIFPIYDSIGRVIGFGARRLREEEAGPKYVNSPTTLVYDKGKVLYGLYQARDALRSQGYALLVEGYMDVLSLHQAGIRAAVATAGTALTVEQLRLLRRYCRQLFVVYDADRAGQQATLRALELALQEGFEVSIVTLPEGEDPDSFVRLQGEEAFRLRIRHAVPFLDFVLQHYQRQGKLQTPAGQAEAVRHSIRLIAAVPDRLMHDFLIRHVASRFGLSESLLYEELARQRRTQSLQQTAPAASLPTPSTAISPAPPKMLPEEQQLFRVVLNSAWAEVDKAAIRAALVSEPAQQLWDLLCNLAEQYGDPLAALIAKEELQQSELWQQLLELAIVREAPSQNWKQYTYDTMQLSARRLLEEGLLRLRLRKIEEQLQQLRSRQGSVESWEEQRRLLEEIQHLAEERQKVLRQLAG
ncbi:MAG: DNA primase [Candidatus Kapabacteria bacterium]|nr:DNA primase [Candidatus Kapabacteria bacterium]MDW8011409.1 DNA primase [Bacteroidota bacterium]